MLSAVIREQTSSEEGLIGAFVHHPVPAIIYYGPRLHAIGKIQIVFSSGGVKPFYLLLSSNVLTTPGHETPTGISMLSE